MKKLFIFQFAIGAVALLASSLLGTVPASQAAGGPVNFISTDEPGPWFKCVGNGCVNAGSESLAIVPPHTVVKITNGTETNSVHTFSSLLFPTGAKKMPFDQNEAFKGSRSVNLKDPGLYVFVCKMHPFMLAAVIVDDPATTGLDLGENITLISYGGISVPTSSDLATRLLRAFFLITNPENYQDHNPLTNLANPPTKPLPMTWHIAYPDVLVKTDLPAPLNLKTVLEARYGQNLPLDGPTDPSLIPPGVGEVWIDTEYEKTTGKTKPGTATAVDTNTWKVTKKVALPGINMNNPHNMWTDKDQTVIYQTQWFDTKLTVFNRNFPFNVIANINVGQAPAHVMTRVDTDQVHVSINGGDDVVELSPFATGIDRRIPTQFPGEKAAQPHAHWMSHDGQTMVTPNSNTGDSTRINIGLFAAPIVDKVTTGTLPIATGMMPDTSKYYVSNYLDSTITCISIVSGACKKDNGLPEPTNKKTINLLLGGGTLANYNPINGFDIPGPGMSQSGALPIQTPVSPNGKWVVTANTLSGTISIIDTNTDTLVKVLKCSAGCHGVNFGAKDDLINGGYYAYVSSKFSNDLIIVDLDTQDIVGRVVLVADGATVKDATPTLYQGMGGQGVLPIPLVYNGWVQNLPPIWKNQLSPTQQNPFPLP